jgi:hypothetical protein
MDVHSHIYQAEARFSFGARDDLAVDARAEVLLEPALVLAAGWVFAGAGADGGDDGTVGGGKVGVDEVVHPLALTPVGDDAGGLEEAEMSGDAVLWYLEGVDDLADAEFVGSFEELNDAEPCGIGERFEGLYYSWHDVICSFKHMIPTVGGRVNQYRVAGGDERECAGAK